MSSQKSMEDHNNQPYKDRKACTKDHSFLRPGNLLEKVIISILSKSPSFFMPSKISISTFSRSLSYENILRRIILLLFLNLFIQFSKILGARQYLALFRLFTLILSSQNQLMNYRLFAYIFQSFHILGGFIGPPGPVRPRKCTPKIRPDGLQVPSQWSCFILRRRHVQKKRRTPQLASCRTLTLL